MGDGIILGSADVQAYVAYLGMAYSIGLAVAICTFLMGYGVWFLIDVFRGGL